MPTANSGPAEAHLIKEGSFRFVSRPVARRLFKSQSSIIPLPSCSTASISPEASHAKASTSPCPLSTTSPSGTSSPCRSKTRTTPLEATEARKLPCPCQANTTACLLLLLTPWVSGPTRKSFFIPSCYSVCALSCPRPIRAPSVVRFNPL